MTHHGRPRGRPGFRSLALATVVAGVGISCFEQPVSERIDIRLLPRDGAFVRLAVRLASPEMFKENPQAQARIEREREAIVRGSDPWSARFEAMAPVAERLTWEKNEGRVEGMERRALVEHRDSLREFFRGSMVTTSFATGDRWAEMVLHPGPGSRATRDDRERFRREAEAWTGHLAAYLREAGRLYEYLDDHPERARPCLGSLLGDILPEEVKSGLDPTTEEESRLVRGIHEEMERTLDLFAVPGSADRSLEELSRIVHDPFPAPLSVAVTGEVLEVEGFRRIGPDRLAVPGLSLWTALKEIEGRWISPDPVLEEYAWLGPARDRRSAFDLDGFVARPRRAAPAPSPSDIGAALETHLAPAPVYRLRWSTATAEDEKELDWDDAKFEE